MKKTSKVISMLLAAAMLAALLAGCGSQNDGETLNPTPTPSPASGAEETPAGTPAAGAKKVTVVLTHKDGTVKNIELETEQETLGRALVEAGVVEDNQSSYGLYILTADGETVNESDEEWWCITKGGESVMVGADSLVIADGETYELTFTVGYSAG